MRDETWLGDPRVATTWVVFYTPGREIVGFIKMVSIEQRWARVFSSCAMAVRGFSFTLKLFELFKKSQRSSPHSAISLGPSSSKTQRIGHSKINGKNLAILQVKLTSKRILFYMPSPSTQPLIVQKSV